MATIAPPRTGAEIRVAFRTLALPTGVALEYAERGAAAGIRMDLLDFVYARTRAPVT